MKAVKPTRKVVLRRSILYTFLAVILGLIVTEILGGLLALIFGGKQDLFAVLTIGLSFGATVGAAQWLSMRGLMNVRLLPWLAVSSVGFGLPWIVAELLSAAGATWLPNADDSLIINFIIGAVLMGLLQARLLRVHTTRAKQWLPLSALAWAVAMGLMHVFVRGAWITMIFVTLLLGYAMGWLIFYVANDATTDPALATGE